MATDLTALTLSAAVSISGAVERGLDLSTPQDSLSVQKLLSYAFGTGAGKANQLFHDRRSLAGGASETLDLSGVLTNSMGGTVDFANVKCIIVFNRSNEALTPHAATDAEIAIGGAAADEFLGPFQAAGDAIGIPAGGMFCIACNDAGGWAVVNDYTGDFDLLKITNLDGADEALFDIVIVGESK